MTNSILNPLHKLSIQSRQETNELKGLVGLVNRSTKKMEKRHVQLTQISQDHLDVMIRMEAEEHLAKQSKMISIAYELMSRITDSYELSKNEKVDSEQIQQYLDELDIMNYMDFEVTKKYFSFINLHFEPRVIRMIPLAA